LEKIELIGQAIQALSVNWIGSYERVTINNLKWI
jgi:hypothetical protein